MSIPLVAISVPIAARRQTIDSHRELLSAFGWPEIRAWNLGRWDTVCIIFVYDFAVD
ncbi:MAG: hypothetical protein WAU86_10620 [Oricola sp.]